MKKSLVLGFFDGVHIAHQAVIQSALDISKNCTLITFKESPAKYFNKPYGYILSRHDSIEKIKSLGITEIIELDFSRIANMSAEEYLEFVIQKFAPVSISTGFNHTFGRQKGGNPEFLARNQEKYGYKYICTPEQTFEGEVVSSTAIKGHLKSGGVEKANSMLGSNFILEGEVVHGAQIGRTIGFPTANIEYPSEIIRIPYGVYKVRLGDKTGLLNWGMKPTVNNTLTPVAEVHILDFEGDLYGKNLRFEVLKHIRPEKKFSGLNELKQQINKDIEACLK